MGVGNIAVARAIRTLVKESSGATGALGAGGEDFSQSAQLSGVVCALCGDCYRKASSLILVS